VAEVAVTSIGQVVSKAADAGIVNSTVPLGSAVVNSRVEGEAGSSPGRVEEKDKVTVSAGVGVVKVM